MKTTLIGAALCLAALAGGAWADGRAALVIGNRDYDEAPRAPSAARDAEAVADALAGAGFNVVRGFDLTSAAMRETVETFRDLAAPADEIVIFYSGHTMRMAGETYLAPTDLAPADPVALAFDAAPFAALLGLAAQTPGAAVIFLDGAALEGFAPSDFAEPGIAEIAAPEGVLIVSAAAPGQALRRSRWRMSGFARAITDRFLAEGAPAMAAADASEDPIWTIGAVPDALTLLPAPEPEPAPAAAGGDSAVAQQIELAFWQSAENAGTKADYEAYLRRYPNGLFADIARNRVGEAESAAAPAPQAAAQPAPPEPAEPAPLVNPAEDAEKALRLTRTARRGIQSDLATLGFDPNGIDGLFGPGTRGAIRRWQDSETRPATGFLDSAQVAALRQGAQDLLDRRAREEAERARLSAAEAKAAEEEAWRRTEQVGTEAAYRRYLEAYPKGPNAPEAEKVLAVAYAKADAAAWADAERVNTKDAYKTYLENYPTGQHAIEAQRRFDLAKVPTQTASTSGPAQETANPAEPAQPAEPNNALRREEEAWRRASAENTTKSYAAFVQSYPNGPFTEEARERRLELIKQQRIARENALGLTRDEWRSIEERLDSLGFDAGDINGRPGQQLRRAIRDYRRSRGLQPHIYVDRKFIRVLVDETRTASAANGGSVIDRMLRLLD